MSALADFFDFADNGSGSNLPGWLSDLTNITNGVTGAYQNIRDSIKDEKDSRALTPAKDWQQYLPWAIGGLVVIGLLYMGAKAFKGKG